MKSGTIRALQEWDDYLAAQGLHFDACILKLTGSAHVPDEQNVAFLQLDDALAKVEVEKAISAFIRDGSWPTLDCRQCLNLSFRAHTARGVIHEILNGTPVGITIQAGLPDLKNRAAFLQWFLIDCWNRCGQTFLAVTTDQWLKTRGNP